MPAFLLAYNEYGLCFETIVSRIEESAIPIAADFYDIAARVAKKMQLPESDYVFLKDLTR